MARKIGTVLIIAGVFALAMVMSGCAPGGPGAAGEQVVKPAAVVKKPALKAQPKEPAAAEEKPARPQAKPEVVPPAPAVEHEQGLTLALMPITGEQTTYRVSTRSQRKINWEGPVGNDEMFKETHNDNNLELTYGENITNVDKNAGATAQITIEKIKCQSVVKNNTVLDYDSSRASDANNILSKLIGLSYGIEFSPDNRIPTVFNLAKGRSLMSGASVAARVGLKIFSPELIRVHHGTLSLPGAKRTVKKGDTWSRIRTFDFGLMGLKSFEKIYTLKDIEQTAGRRIADIEMHAIPTAKVEKRFKKRQNEVQLPNNFDSNDIYTGRAKVDIDNGRIESCHEQLHANWVAAMPGEGQQEPVVLKMSAIRTYDLEKIK